MALSNAFDLYRLTNAVNYNRRVLETYRREYVAGVRAAVGSHYSEEVSSDRRSPVNMLSLYIQVVLRSLAPKAPRVAFSTFNRGLKPTVATMEGWANRQLVKTNFGVNLQRFVLDSLFSIGIMKVALANPSESILSAGALEPGEVFARPVSIDDWVCDMRARDLSECNFLGHRYRVPLDTIRDSRLYSTRRKELVPSVPSQFNLEGDERIGSLGGAYNIGLQDDWEDWVELYEIYLPRHKCIYVFAADDLVGVSADGKHFPKPLREFDWVGPTSGPYHFLPMIPVPGNCMPKGPIMDLIDLNEMVNSSIRKLRNQGEREKEVTLVSGGQTEAGTRTMNANDGDMISVDNAEATKVVRYGGISQVGEAYFRSAKDLFAYMAGNLDMMAGLAPQSKTATQDKILSENASRGLADMQDKTLTSTSSILTALAWFWWHDPYKVMVDVHALPGLPNMSIRRQATPEQRIRGNWDDVDLHVDPYSMQHSTPQSKLALINSIVQQTIMPMLPILQQQGIGFDVNEYLRLVSQMADVPELQDFTTIQEQPLQLEEGGGEAESAPGMPQSTTRNYVRESTSEKTRSGQDQAAITNLLGNRGGLSNGSAMTGGTNGNRLQGSAA